MVNLLRISLLVAFGAVLFGAHPVRAGYLPTGVSPMAYGCRGDGVTDDTTCMQNALNAAASSTLDLGNYKYRVGPLSSAATVAIKGAPGGAGIYNSTCVSGFVAKNANETLLTLTGSHSSVTGVCFQMAASFGSNTSGSAIVSGVSTDQVFKDNQINYPFVGFDVTGSGTNQNVETVVQGNTVVGPSNGGAAIRVGANSTGQSTVDTRIYDNTILYSSSNTATGILYLDAGGFYQVHNSIFQMGTGTKLFPGAGQIVNGWMYGILGDSSYTNDGVIDANGGSVTFVNGTAMWTSSATAANLLIQQTSGTVENIHLDGFTDFIHGGGSSTQIALDIEAGSYINVQNWMVCLATNDAAAVGIKVAAAATNVTIGNGKVGSCLGSLQTGIQIGAGPTALSITGNDLQAVAATPVSYTPSTGSTVDTVSLTDNLGVDNVTGSVASGSTISLPINPVVNITGSTTVNTIQGWWTGRVVTVTATTGSLTLAAGTHGVCNATVLAAANASAVLSWNSATGCWGVTNPAAGNFTSVTVNGAAATNRLVNDQTAGVARWSAGANVDAESGANAGSNFVIARFSDAGSFIDNPVFVTRSSGLVTMIDGLTVAGGVTTTATTFSGLPGTPSIGTRAYITDDNAACTFGTTATGGGSTKCGVVWNGSNWVAG